MVSSKTRKQILEHKWNESSNESQFIKRRIVECHSDLEDLALFAEEFAEMQIKEMFTTEKLTPFILALLGSRMDPNRKFLIDAMLLRLSLDSTEKLIDNKLLKQQYKQHKVELKKIIDSIREEKETILGNFPDIDSYASKKKR